MTSVLPVLLLLLSGAMSGQTFGRQTWRIENGLPQNTVRAILQTSDGYIWVGTEGGLARFDGERFAVFSAQNTPALKSNMIRALAEGGDGSLWIATADGLTRLWQGQFRHYGVGEGLPGNNVWSVSVDRGMVRVATAAGIAVRRLDRFEAVVDSGEAAHEALSPRTIVAFHDSAGRTWTGSDNGLALSRDGRNLPLRAENSFAGEAVLAITQDREGSIWIGTDTNGLSILRRQTFTTLTTRDGLPDDAVRCVFQDREGALWVGTQDRGLGQLLNGRFSTLTTRDGLTSNVILALAQDGNGTLLVGTPDGLNRIKDGKVSTVTSADGLPDDFVRSILPLADGSLWLGTRRGLVHWQAGRVAALYGQADGLGSDLIGAMALEGDSLWIATLGGVAHFQKGHFQNFTTRDGLSSNVVTALHSERDGTLWIGTQGGGLNARVNGKFVHFGTTTELPETIYGMTEDAAQNLWLSSDVGIFRVNRNDLLRVAKGESQSATVIPYGAGDGLAISEAASGGHPSVWRANDGALWFATVKGVAVAETPTELNLRAPEVVVESVSIDDRTLEPRDVTAIQPGQSRLAFEYAGLSFIAPQKLRFRYKLEGFDHNWVDARNRRVAYYTNLFPGHYTFRVLARNNDGVWDTQGSLVSFRMEPHFYQTYWFGSLMLLAIGLAVYMIYRWRVKQVEAQFSAVLQERNRIAREIHDTLAQGFAGVSVQLEIVSRLLATSAAVAREHLDQARVLVRSSLGEARRSIWELRSQSAESGDLAARISKMASQVASASGSKVRLQVKGTYRPLAEKMEEELLKIAQEAITNAVRHGEAENIDIELAFDARKVRMTIADNGRGFSGVADSTGPNGHFGLRGMRERAEQIHAELTLESVVGKGTKVFVQAGAN